METRLLGAALAVPLVAAGLALNATSANAARIGTFDLAGRVNVTGTLGADGTAGTADDNVTFAFDRTRVTSATGGFAALDDTTATVNDLTLAPNPPNPNGTTFPFDFVTLDATGEVFTLTTITPPSFTPVVTPGGNNTTFVQYAFDGVVRSNSGQAFAANGIFTSQFTGSPSDLPTLIAGGGLTTSYSASFEAVPEPFTIAGAGMAVGFGAFFRKRVKKQAQAKKN